ncbi:winged helix-turn-helix transcriptional regulator [Amaricoccus sp.]|uniref:winged helix-turn-helix transcriptional regulator n=1 Tax=Amaricoccus sp. TaxID=1872485 RepID=UPI0039E2BE29
MNGSVNTAYVEKVALASKVVSGRWRIEVLCALREAPVRLSALLRMFPLASKKCPISNLRFLEVAGIVARRGLSTSALDAEYELLPGKREPFLNLLNCLAEYGEFLAVPVISNSADMPPWANTG